MDLTVRVYQLLLIYLRAPVPVLAASVPLDGNGNPVFTFDPVLTAGEQVTYNRIVSVAKSLVPGITPAEWVAIQSDIDGLVTYQGLANPTLAQTVLAVKAQSRILRAIIRN
jgi:hypothetical protein